MRIGIIGAGIAGLSMANLIGSSGHDVTVFDSASRLEPVGAGFTLQPNGINVLAKILDLKQVLKTAAPISRSTMFNSDGTPLPIDVMDKLSAGERSYSIHRGDIHDALMQALPEGLNVVTSMKVSVVSQEGDEVVLHFENGVKDKFDLVIGADGVKSIARDFVSQNAVMRLGHGVAIRALVPRHLDDEQFENFRAWMGRNKVVLSYPVRGGEFLNIACYLDDSVHSAEGWSSSVDPEIVRGEFRDWDPLLVELLDRAENFFSWKLADVENLMAWTRGRVVLIGDAAHAMVPYLGQGANQALTDACALANCLVKFGEGAVSLEDALLEFQQLRLGSAQEIQRLSRLAGLVFKSDPAEGLDIKSQQISALLKKVSTIYDKENYV